MSQFQTSQTDVSQDDLLLHRRVESFIYREALLADESRYIEWEELWAEDGTYWVPLTPTDDPYNDTSIIFDNRRRIGIRIRQLVEGNRPTQTPTSRVRRVVSNVQIVGAQTDQALPTPLGDSPADVRAYANFVGVEAQHDRRTMIAGRTLYRLRQVDNSFRIVLKRVELVDSDLPLRTLSFLL
jgi:benzoate/toluate 1,2-dioxygenase subunit beta